MKATDRITLMSGAMFMGAEPKKENLIGVLVQNRHQKPLTMKELKALIDTDDDVVTYCESYNDPHAYATIWYQGMNIDRDGQALDNERLIWDRYGETWRAWVQRPTDEEREAAPWEE